MVTLFGTTYYTIGTGLVVLALLAPLFFWFSRWLLRPNVEGQPRRRRLAAEGALTFGLLALAAVGLYWDVYLIGQRAKELCEQTGLVVTRTALAHGFVGSSAIEAWATHGFRFVETDQRGKLVRYELTDGKVIATSVTELRSQFALRSNPHRESNRHPRVASRISLQLDQVIEVSSGVVLGELKRYTIDYGWADRLFIDLSGFSASPRTCGRTRDHAISTGRSRLNVEDLVLATLKTN